MMVSSSVGLRRSNAHLFSSLVQVIPTLMAFVIYTILNALKNSSVRRAPRAPFTPRFLSTGSSTELEKSVSSPEIIPDTSFIPDGTEVTEVATGFASHIPPLQYGDLAALDLINWYPAGIVRWSFEILNVSIGLPWFWTIVAGTVFWRVACLPFSIYSLRESAKMQPLAKKFGDLRQEMLDTGRVSVNSLEHERAKYEYNAFQRKHDLNPVRGLAGLVQFPVTLGLFFGVQKMTTLPVEQLTQSGFALLQDLTIPDPTYILPAALLALVNVQISVRRLSPTSCLSCLLPTGWRQGHGPLRATRAGPHHERPARALTV